MGALTRVVAAAVVVALAAACAGPLYVETLPEAKGRPLAKLALLPFEYPEAGDDAPALVTAKVLEALVQDGGFDVIPTTEVSLALRDAGFPTDAKRIGTALHSSFGCDGVVSGSVGRFEDRVGGPRGVTHPASVAFELEVRDPGGVLLWRGRYDETQEDVAANLLTVWRARERSFEWVTAEALAAYGARGLARELRESAASWR
jgi:hypothetical protein